MRTLVVEDNKGTRDMLESVLVARGHRVTTTERAETATALHHADPFDLLLLDIVLPGMDGLKLCRWLRSLPRGEVPVILAITSRNSPQDLQAVLTAGATDYLAKPVEPALLQTRLRWPSARWRRRPPVCVRRRRCGAQKPTCAP